MTLKQRIEKLKPLIDAASSGEVPAGRVVFYHPTPGHGEPGIWTDEPARTAIALWGTAQIAYRRRQYPLWAPILERTLTDLETIAAWAAEQQQTK